MSKRVNILYLFSTMLLLLLTGCEQEASLTPLPNGEEPVEIRLSARVADVSTEITRAGTDFHTSLVGTTIGLYGLRGVGESFSDSIYMHNRDLEYDSQNASLTSSTSKIYFPTGREKAFLYAYCPYTDAPIPLPGNGKKLCIRVKGGMSSDAGYDWLNVSDDPLYAQAESSIVRKQADETGATPSGNAHFDFIHRMARLKVLVTTQATEEYYLQAINVTFTVHQHGYMDISTGDITTAYAAKEVCTETFTDVSFRNTTTPQLDYSAFPGKGTIAKIELIVKMGVTAGTGATYTVFEAEPGRDIDLEPGKTTKVTINFNPSANASASLDNTWETSEVPINYN